MILIIMIIMIIISNEIIGGKRLSSVFKTVLKYPHVYYRGFPDLAFWDVNVDNNNAHENINIDEGKPWIHDTFFAVEVKSEHDRLSSYQEIINELLYNSNIPIEVFKVTSR